MVPDGKGLRNAPQGTRVLHIITRLIVGGAQENTMLTAAMLESGRFQVDVVAGPQTGPEGSLIEEVRSRGVPLTIEPSLVREVNPVKDLAALLRLTALIRRGRYAIVHTHSSKAGILGRWAAWLARTPIIVHTVHGWGHHERQHPYVRKGYILLERLTLRITDRLVAVSPLNVEKGLADGIGRTQHYTIIRSGIELDRFGRPRIAREEMRARLGIPLDAPVVGSVTRLSPQKAPLDFVQAAATAMRRMPEAWFVLVGDGPLRAEVEAQAAQTGLDKRLVLTGLRRDVPELLGVMDVFVLSSLWEGLPRVLPQAMAAGLPIVATAIDGNAEAVEEGVNGRLVPPGDTDAMAEAIIALLQDPTRAGAMGAAGKARVDEFSARAMVDDIAELYEQLLAEKGLATCRTPDSSSCQQPRNVR
jgi:glycosyltransferase involved in cell wall biosynthesis